MEQKNAKKRGYAVGDPTFEWHCDQYADYRPCMN